MKKLPACFRLRHVFALLVALGCATGTRAATFTVTTAADEFNTPSGANVSLREALRDAAAAAGADTIVFTNSFNIALTNEIILADTNVTVDASALAAGVTLNGNAHRIFSISAGANVTLLGLTLTGGNGAGATANNSGEAIYNVGTFTATRCTFRGNTATSQAGPSAPSAPSRSRIAPFPPTPPVPLAAGWPVTPAAPPASPAAPSAAIPPA